MLGFHHLYLVPRLIMYVAVPLLLYAFMAWTGAALAFMCDTSSGLVEVVFLIRCVTSAGKEVHVLSAGREVFV